MRYNTDAVNVLEEFDLIDKHNHPREEGVFRSRKLTRDKLVRVKSERRGKFTLKDERFRSMVSTTNPPEWAITLGVVEYDKPPTIWERGTITTIGLHGHKPEVKEL